MQDEVTASQRLFAKGAPVFHIGIGHHFLKAHGHKDLPEL